MTSTSGPPSYPPYGPPPQGGGPQGPAPYGPGRPSSSSSSTVMTSVLAVLFVIATVVAAVVVNDQDSKSTAVGPVNGTSGVPLPGVSGSGGVQASGGLRPTAALPTPTLPSLTTSSYVPPTPPSTPTHVPLSPETINRTFQVYMNALLNRSLSQLKLATCPKLRHTETGTALDGKYINRWRGHRYTIYNSLDYVIIAATVRYVNPNTGGNGGTHVYSWYVTRYPNGRYWVCGIRG